MAMSRSAVAFLVLLIAASTLVEGKKKIKYKYPDLFPEGIDWDAKHNRFLLGSVKQGVIVALSPNGKAEAFVEDPEIVGNATAGLKVDPAHNRVVVAIHGLDPEAPYEAVASYDLDTAERKLLVELHNLEDPPGPSLANDVAVDSKGNIYATNTAGNNVWKVDTYGAASILTSDPAFSEVEAVPIPKYGVMGLNGIVSNDKQGYLLVGHSSGGALFKVQLPGLLKSSATVTSVSVSEPLGFIDGLAFRPDGKLVAVSRDAVFLLRSHDNYATAQVLEKQKLKHKEAATAAAVKDGDTFLSFMFMDEFFKGSSRKKWHIVEVDFKADRPVKAPKKKSSSSRDAFQVLAVTVASIVCFSLLALAFRKEREQGGKVKVT